MSYADFITLLFAFFVVMFATAQADKSRAKAVSQAIDKALKNGTVSPAITALLKSKSDPAAQSSASTTTNTKENGENIPATQKQLPDEELLKPLAALTSSLQEEIKRGSISLALERRGLIVKLQTGALFPSGGATLGTAAYPTIEEVAKVLNTLPNPLRLEGHTDSLPIKNSQFQSNWELSAARSIAMLRFLHENFGVERERMAIVGYADTSAVQSNETEEGRERNRRVDIVILSSYGMQSEPASHLGQASNGHSGSSQTDSK